MVNSWAYAAYVWDSELKSPSETVPVMKT